MRKKMWRVMAFVMAFAMVTATGCSKNDNSAEESSDLNVKVTDEKVKVATPTNYELVATATTKLSTTETSETTETTMTEVTFTSEEVGVPYNPSSGSGGGGNSSGSGSSRSEVAEATEIPLESSVVELPLQLSTDNFETDTYGNSILISWDADASRSYEIYLSGMSNTVYDSYFDFSFGLGTCVISGLESGISYTVRVTPLLSDEEKEAGCESTTQIFPAENIVVLDKPTASKEYKVEQAQNKYPYVLDSVADQNAIAECFPDMVTGTGILRNELGDYCVAMSSFYGNVGDRYHITLSNGMDFNVYQVAVNGSGEYETDGMYHILMRFVTEESDLPASVKKTGDYGTGAWKGFTLNNIEKIEKIK